MAEWHALRVNRPNVVDETLDGEALIVNLGTGVYYSIASTGEVIWRMLVEGMPPAAVTSHLQAMFDVTEHTAADSVAGFVEELLAEELLVPGEDGAPKTGIANSTDAIDGPRAAFVLPELKRYADMQDLLLLDPVHDVDERGWPEALPDAPHGAGRHV
ncbi:MAG: PqqD family protein [Tepidiformaceae bacterium]